MEIQEKRKTWWGWRKWSKISEGSITKHRSFLNKWKESSPLKSPITFSHLSLQHPIFNLIIQSPRTRKQNYWLTCVKSQHGAWLHGEVYNCIHKKGAGVPHPLLIFLQFLFFAKTKNWHQARIFNSVKWKFMNLLVRLKLKPMPGFW